MAKHSRLKVLTTMLETGVVPQFYHGDPDVAERVVRACLEGGAHCVEFTNRGDGAHLVFGELVRRFREERQLILGAGTVLDEPTAALYIQLGANFIVGPNFNPEVARLCNRRKIPYTPGCGTASEISNAEELGVEICKIFPAGEMGGPSFIQKVRGPMPWVRLMPTGGISPDKENITAWIQAGAACLGLGNKIITPQMIESGDFPRITEIVRQVLVWIREARQGISVI